jgi:MFS family permease
MKTSKLTIKLAILFYSLVQIGTICISSVLAKIAELFPQYSATTIQFLATCPCLVIIIMALVTGKLAEFIAKKYLALFSSSMFIVTAVGGFVSHQSLFILYVWEVTLGIGIGILVSLGTSLITDYFDGEERKSIMGLQSAAISIGGVVLSLFGGLLATIGWYYNYLTFLLIIPGFILLLIGLPVNKPIRTKKSGVRVQVTARVVFVYGVIAFLFMLLFNVIPTNLAMHLKETGIAGSVNAGIASAVLMLSGVPAGLLYKSLARLLGERVIALGFFNLALGSFITTLSGSFILILIGVFIAGFSLSLVMAQTVVSIAEKEHVEAVTMSISCNMAINNMGSFLSPYFTKLARMVMHNELAATRYLIVSVIAFLIAVLLFCGLKNRQKADAV